MNCLVLTMCWAFICTKSFNALTHLILPVTLRNKDYYYPTLLRSIRGSEKLSNLFKVTQLSKKAIIST